MRTSSLALLAALLVPALPSRTQANEGAAEVAMGGIQLRTERRVSMRKERLFISLGKIAVEYEFVNESSEDVVTEVAFPIPEYDYTYAYGIGPHIDEFRVWAGDRPIRVVAEPKAFVGGREVTGILESMGIDIATMGRLYDAFYRIEPDGSADEVRSLAQIPKLAPELIEKLRAQHVVGTEQPYLDKPLWTVRLTYHWLQHFPPGQVVRMRHEYTPIVGEWDFIYPDKFADACVEPPLAKLLKGLQPSAHVEWDRRPETFWVKYILTTANTWKTPIRDFELQIEFPEGYYVSLCWDGKLEKSGPRTFRSTLTDFVPKRELAVYYFRPPGVPRAPVRQGVP